MPVRIDGTDITGATIDGTDVTEITVDGDTVFTAVPANAFQLTSLSGVLDTGGNFTDSSRIRGIEFNGDGTRFIQTDTSASAIFEAELATPYDLSSQTTVNSYPIVGSRTADCVFSRDGLHFYECDSINPLLAVSNLSTPYDLSTKSLDTTSSVSPLNGPFGLDISPDGKTLVTADINNERYEQYSMSVAHDLSTLSFDGSFDPGDSRPTGIEFNADGSKLYTCSRNDPIREYTLSTPFEILSGRTQINTKNRNHSNLDSIRWSDDGGKFFECYLDDGVDEYEVV